MIVMQFLTQIAEHLVLFLICLNYKIQFDYQLSSDSNQYCDLIFSDLHCQHHVALPSSCTIIPFIMPSLLKLLNRKRAATMNRFKKIDFIDVYYSFRYNRQNSGFFPIVISQVDKIQAVFFNDFYVVMFCILPFNHQAKRKQALLESNLPGISLMTDEKVKMKGY